MEILLALRNARRNTRRSALTATTVLLGCALLTIGLSVVKGIHGNFIDAAVRSGGHVRLVSEVFAQREQLNPIYENIPDTAPVLERVTAIDGVVAAYPRIQMGVAASVEGREVGEVFGLLVGAPIDYFDSILDLRPRVIDGAFFSEDSSGEAMIGRALASDMGVAAGDEAIFLGQTQDGSLSPIRVEVVGVVDTGNGLFDKQVFVPLAKARWMADIPDGAVEVLIFGEDERRSGAIQAALEPALADLAAQSGVVNLEGEPVGLTMSTWSTREPLASLLIIARWIMGSVASIIVFITALGVLNTMLMSVLERTGEIGVLRAMGMKVRSVVLMFVLEAVIISTIGGLIGAIIGSIASIALEATGVDLGTAASNMPDTIPVNRILRPDWDLELAVMAFALGIVMAFVGSALPAIRAARIQPVNAMRARR